MTRRKLLLIVIACLVLVAGGIGAYLAARPSASPASALTLASISPRTGYSSAPVSDVTVTGTGFGLGMQVSLRRSGHADIAGSGFSLMDSTQLRSGSFPLSGAAAGAWDVVIADAEGRSVTCTACFEILNPGAPPTLASVSPRDAFKQGSEAIELTLTGSQFHPDVAIAISGAGVAVRSVSFTSSTLIRAEVRVGNEAPLGARNVTVTNPDGQRASCDGCFAVAAGPPAISSVNPSRLGAGLRDVVVEVGGSRFAEGTRLDLGPGIRVTTTVISATSLKASVSVASSTALGPRAVKVVNPDAQKAVCEGCLTVDGAPAIARVEPGLLPPGGASTTITVVGSGFMQGSVLSASGSRAFLGATQFLSADSLRVEIRVATSSTDGPLALTVTNPDGTAGSCERCLTVGFPTPEVSGSTPASLVQGQQDRSLTITGSGFRQGLTASFSAGGPAIGQITFVNATTLVLSVDVGAGTVPGSYALTVTNPDGKGDTCGRCLTVTAAPAASSTNPAP